MFFTAGKLGFNVLTANFALKNDLNEFVRRSQIYRESIEMHHGRRGHITMMLHTFVAESAEAIERLAKPALAEYINVNIGMQQDHDAGGKEERGFTHLNDREREILIRTQVNKDIRGQLSFIGTLEHCARQAERLKENGVDEIACLIDFGIDLDEIMSSLGRMSLLLETDQVVATPAAAEYHG